MMKVFIVASALALSLASNAQEKWTLRRCIDYAIENNVTVKRQQASIEQSEIELDNSKMNRLPSVNASASQSWHFGRGLTSNNTYANTNTSSTSFDVSANVLLFSGMRQVNNIHVREFDLQAALADMSRVKEDISINVASQYLQVLYNYEMLGVANRQVELSQQLVSQKVKLAQNGKATECDVAEVRAQLSQDELSVVQAQNNYKLSLLELSQMLELPSPDNFAVVEPDTAAQLMAIANVDEVFAEALRSKSVIKGDEYRIESAEKEVSVAKGAYLPTLSLAAGLGSSYYNTNGMDMGKFGDQMSNNFNKYIVLSLNVPVFNKFATRNSVRSAKVALSAQTLQLDQDKKTLYKEIQQAYYNAVAAQSKYGSSLVAEQSAQTSFALMTRKFENGKATQTEYNQSRLMWMKSVSDMIQAKYDYIFRSKILDYYKGVELD